MLPRNPLRWAALLAAALLASVAAKAELKAGDPFPSLAPAALVNLGGGAIPALDGHVTLVDFWASWCAPCKASFPVMAKLHEEYSGRGLQIVAISIDEKANAATSFWKRMSPPFTALHDRQQKLVQQVVVPTMPTSYLVDRTGRVRYVHAGFHNEVAELKRQIEELLAEKS